MQRRSGDQPDRTDRSDGNKSIFFGESTSSGKLEAKLKIKLEVSFLAVCGHLRAVHIATQWVRSGEAAKHLEYSEHSKSTILRIRLAILFNSNYWALNFLNDEFGP